MNYEIKHYLQAGYPLIWKEEHDEYKFIKQLKEIAKNGKTKRTGSMDLYVWDIVKGLTHYNEDVSKTSELKSEANFDKFLDNILKKMKEEEEKKFKNKLIRPSIFVLVNVEHILNQSLKAQQIFKEFIHYGKEYEQHIICLSTTMNYPKTIEKDLAIIPYKYPEEYMIEDIIDNLAGSDIDKILKAKLVQASKGLTLTEVENALSLAIVENRGLNNNSVQTVQRIKTQMLGANGILTYIPPEMKMSDIGGLEDLKEWLEIRKSALFNEEAIKYGLKEPKGVLIAGVPGAGKSLTAKAVASSWELPLLHFDISQVFGGLVGQSEKQMKDTLKIVESISPCILWLDEVEKAFSNVGSSSDSGATSRVFGQFLTWMQEKKSTVFVVATANDVQNLPSAFIRKGRFDEFFFVDLPNEKEREAILDLHFKKRNRNSYNFNMNELISETNGFVGAELEEVINTALYNSFFDNREVEQSDLMDAIQNTTPISKTMKEEIEGLRHWAKDRARNASKESTKVSLDEIKSRSDRSIHIDD